MADVSVDTVTGIASPPIPSRRAISNRFGFALLIVNERTSFWEMECRDAAQLTTVHSFYEQSRSSCEIGSFQNGIPKRIGSSREGIMRPSWEVSGELPIGGQVVRDDV